MSLAKQIEPCPIVWKWDKWQQKVLDYDGNITLRTGRQVGKSEVIAAKAKNFAINNPNTTIMIIAASQRQSSLLFEKVRAYIDREEENTRKRLYKEKPTLTKILLKNGSKIHCLPAGRTGYFIRGFSIDVLIADEAAYIPEIVWNSVLPMIAVSRRMKGMGFIILLSTPFGKGGYFYNSFTDKGFRAYHISSEDCSRIPKEFLRKEKKRMSVREYRQEYMGEFTDDMSQFFSTELIQKQANLLEWKKVRDYDISAKYYLGVDFAGYGGDENAMVVCEMKGDHVRAVVCEVTRRKSAIDTINRIVAKDEEYKFRKIFVDDGGIGSPITDILQEKMGRKVLGINNSSKRIEVNGEEKRRGILKEDLYSNVLTLMEMGKLDIIRDLDLIRSMKSITFDYGSETGKRNLSIFGGYAHLTEALVRSCWCTKEKGLSIFRF